jgi:hypothetical protein
MKIQLKGIAATLAALALALPPWTGSREVRRRRHQHLGPRMDTNNNRECTRMNTKTDKPQINQPSSGWRWTMAGKLQI